MKLKELINKSTYCSTGHISCREDIDKLEQYILYNAFVLSNFSSVNYITNYTNESYTLSDQVRSMISYYGYKSINSGISKGHSFGAAENDNLAFNSCNNIWLCKSAHDMIFNESILEKEIGEADFYYMTSVGYSALFNPYNVTSDKVYLTNKYFYPQTNFYFLNKSKVDYLNDQTHIDEIYNLIKSVSNYNGRAWEYGFRSCEFLLKESIERNNLKYFNLIDKEKFDKLLNIVKDLQIHDPSHKNIMIDGICHFHNKDEKIIEI